MLYSVNIILIIFGFITLRVQFLINKYILVTKALQQFNQEKSEKIQLMKDVYRSFVGSKFVQNYFKSTNNFKNRTIDLI